MHTCPRCGQSVSATYVVCHACGYLPSADDLQLQPAGDRPTPAMIPSEIVTTEGDGVVIKEPVEIERGNPFNEYVLPWILIGVGLVPNIIVSVVVAGALGILAIVVDLALLVGVQIPLTAGVMILVGILFGINFGWLSTGVVKLAGISLFVRGVGSVGYLLLMNDQIAAAAVVVLIGLLVHVWLFKTLFDLDVFETIVSLVVVGLCLALLQFATITLLLAVFKSALP